MVERSQELLVPSIAVYEVCKILLSKTSRENVVDFIHIMEEGRIILLDVPLCINAADISRMYRLPMADSIIYATAKKYDAVLWTTDQHFAGLPNVRYFGKTEPLVRR
jgi:predicted nucleic acid-binding protein